MEETKKPEKTKPKKQNKDKKAVINNQIIQFQGKFKQAKVVTIRKLVKKLKNPEKNPKQNRASKAERYQNVLNELKHISPKRLGLLSLLYYKSGKNYLADQSSTVEQQAVGYFCEDKALCATLDTIRNKLKLDDSSIWRKAVKKLFRKKDKTKKDKKVSKKASSAESADAEVDSDADVDEKPKGAKKKDKQKVDTTDKPEKSAKQQKKQKEKPAKQEESEESSESEEENEVPGPAPTTVDDFFITADGSNYLSTAIANEKPDEDSDDGSNRKVYEKKPSQSSFFHKNDKPKPVKLGPTRFEGAKRKWPNEVEEQVPKPKETKIDPELHPSWQAKQKQKPTITEFKGKKITFD